MKKIFMVFSFVIFASSKCYTQSWEMERVMPPEVFHFDLAVKSEVGATGALNVSIPLLTVPGRGGLDMPINLSYTSGIKTRQQSSWVGLGWMLDLGSITRSVHLLPDYDQVSYENRSPMPDYPDYYTVSIPELSSTIFQTATSGTNLSFKLESTNDWKIEYTTASYTGLRTGYNTVTFADRDYDVNSGNRINSLHIDNNPLNGLDEGNRQISYTDIDKFILTSPNGTKYVFGLPLKSETTVEYEIDDDDGEDNGGFIYKFVMEYNSNWRLTAILSPDFVDGGGDPYDPLDVNETNCKGNWVFIEYYYITNMRLINGPNPNLLMQATYPAFIYTPTHRLMFITSDNAYDVGYFMPDAYTLFDNEYIYNAYQKVIPHCTSIPGMSYEPQRLDSAILTERSSGKRLKGYKFHYAQSGNSNMLSGNGGSWSFTKMMAYCLIYNPASEHPYADIYRSSNGTPIPVYAFEDPPGGGGGGCNCASETETSANNNTIGKLTLLKVEPFDGMGHIEPAYQFKYKSFNPYYFITKYAAPSGGEFSFEFTSGIPLDRKLNSPDSYYRYRSDRFGYFYAMDNELIEQGYTIDTNEVRVTNGAIAYSLERITYPTGGYEEYTYERNQFASSDKSETNWGLEGDGGLSMVLATDNGGLDPDRECGIRLKLKKIVSESGQETLIRYIYGDGHLSCPPLFTWRRITSDLFQQLDRGKNVVEYDWIEELYSDASRIRRTYNTGSFSFNKQATIVSKLVPVGMYSKLIIETSYDWKRNQVTKIEHKNSSSSVIKSNAFTYDYPIVSQTDVLVTEKQGTTEIPHYMTLFSGLVRKTSQTDTEYDQNGSNNISKTTTYNYPTNSPYPSTITEAIDGTTYLRRVTKFKYAKDFTTTAGTIGLMKTMNILSPVIEKTIYKDSESASNVVYSEAKEWQNFTIGSATKPKPYKFYKWRGSGSFSSVSENVSTGALTFDSNYKLQGTINSYDNYGNFPTSITDALGVTTTFQWSDTYKGAKLTQRGLTINGVPLFQNYTYNSFHQVEKIIDENSVETRYEYDGFGRLVKVVGPAQETLKEIFYHFKEN